MSETSGGSGFDTPHGRARIAREQRRIDRTEEKAEASEMSLKKLIKSALKDEEQKQVLAKDCLDGVKGKKDHKLETEERAGFGALREGEVTGYEPLPWEEDDA